MATEKSSGSQTAVIDTEHTLLDTGDAGNYVLYVDLSEMVLGDITTLRIYLKVRSSSSYVLFKSAVYPHVQGEPAVAGLPVGSPHGYKATLEQTDGTGRAYEWSVVSL